MWLRLDHALSAVGALLAGVVRAIVALRAERCLYAAALLATGVLVTLFGAVAYCTSGASQAAPVVDVDQAWRYLVVCEACGHRVRVLDHPARTWPREGSMLKCPACGEFKATWYRRGSQSVPPGGW